MMDLAKYQKINVLDAGEAISKGQTLRMNDIKNAAAEEAIKTDTAEKEFFGNYLTKKGLGIDATDENQDGTIDENEKKNAIIKTGRQYKAWDRTRDDEEIAARRAAMEGRAIRAEQRSIEKHKVFMEKADALKEDNERYYKSLKQQCIDNGGSEANCSLVENAARTNNMTELKTYSKMDFGKQIDTLGVLDRQMADNYITLNAYSEAHKAGDKMADQKGIEAGKKILAQYDSMIERALNQGNTELAKGLTQIKKKFPSLTLPDGSFNYQGLQKFQGEMSHWYNNYKMVLDKQELEASTTLPKNATANQKESADVEGIMKKKRAGKKISKVETQRLKKYFKIPDKIASANKQIDTTYDNSITGTDDQKKMNRVMKIVLSKVAEKHPEYDVNQMVSLAEKITKAKLNIK